MANYNDIDDILAGEEYVPVVFHQPVNGVRIDDSTERGYVEQGSKSELPFWLARELHLRTRLEIEADAACVDLKSRCPYFYEFGCKLAPLCDKTISLLLSYAFKIRYKEVLFKAHTTASVFFGILTKEEINLYEAAQSSMAAFKKWRIGGPRIQRALILGGKRKPAE